MRATLGQLQSSQETADTNSMNEAVQWDVIEQFIGFGNPKADVLFLGMEEGLSDGASLEDDLLSRSRYRQYEDLEAAQLLLGKPSRFFGPSPVAQRTWRPMCHLMLRRENASHIDNDARCRYQAQKLGRFDRQTLLSELLPYPNPNTQEWHYAERFASRTEMIATRVALLAKTYETSAFKIAIAYGTSYWPYYKEIFKEVCWQTIDDFEVGVRRDTRIVLTPHLSSRAFNTQEQLDRFADIALA